jgi:hypothetical protein
MANAIYDKALESFANAQIAWLTDTIKAVLVDTNGVTPYVFSQTHQFLSDVPVGSRVATSPALSNKTNVSGFLDADDVTFPGVSGQTAASGLPITPNTGNITVGWDNGTYKIMAL